MNRSAWTMRWLLGMVVALTVAACASMGRPQGGPIDETPPEYVRSSPMPGQTNVSTDRYVIEFNENVQIKDIMDKVVVSPPQKSFPKISAVGRKVRVELGDTLQPNTTYTLDFTNSISDLNEGNELDGFALAFSTGPVLDSLCISGMVFEAANLEPAQGMLVGVHSNLSDTAITTLPFDRITRTDQLGRFTVRNLKPGTYRIYALNDKNRDNHWDRTEDVAFYDVTIDPSSQRVEVTDTLAATDGADSIVTRMATRFLPNDVLLTWFNEDYHSQYLVKYDRPVRNRVHFEFGAKADSLPRLTILSGSLQGQPLTDHAVLAASPTLDTLDYWITTPELIALDSLYLEARYLRTDTAQQLSATTDTLKFIMKPAKAKKKKKVINSSETTPGDSAATDTVVVTLTKLQFQIPTTADVFSPIIIDGEVPIKSIRPESVHLHIMVDTLWEELEPPTLAATDSLRPMRLKADYEWEPGQKYKFTIDSMGVTDIYDHYNGPFVKEFSVRNLNEYANLTFNIQNLHGPAVALLLTKDDKPVRYAVVENSRAEFSHVMPGIYYARLFLDRNSNGRYDTGSLLDSVQPEEVYYYPSKLNLKANWDVAQTWDLDATPLDKQKPEEIKKNRPKVKGQMQRLDTGEKDDDTYYDEFGNPSVDPNDPFGKKKNNRYNDLKSRDALNNNTNGGYRSGNMLR